MKVADDKIGLMPCLEVKGDYLRMTVRVTSYAPVEAVTVWVWLSADRDGFRVDESMKRCFMTFAKAGETQVCENAFTPIRPGKYDTTTNARLGQADFPPGWDNFPESNGAQSGFLQWPPAR
ncbi:hypothetical protein [Plantactinospora sp. B5E13]|uniref:hypothetical protein n=1 Tax=Plantactinospora sp. B5E13 TaxID=3153758 RepID=UPI00325D16C5